MWIPRRLPELEVGFAEVVEVEVLEEVLVVNVVELGIAESATDPEPDPAPKTPPRTPPAPTTIPPMAPVDPVTAEPAAEPTLEIAPPAVPPTVPVTPVTAAPAAEPTCDTATSTLEATIETTSVTTGTTGTTGTTSLATAGITDVTTEANWLTAVEATSATPDNPDIAATTPLLTPGTIGRMIPVATVGMSATIMLTALAAAPTASPKAPPALLTTSPVPSTMAVATGRRAEVSERTTLSTIEVVANPNCDVSEARGLLMIRDASVTIASPTRLVIIVGMTLAPRVMPPTILVASVRTSVKSDATSPVMLVAKTVRFVT